MRLGMRLGRAVGKGSSARTAVRVQRMRYRGRSCKVFEQDYASLVLFVMYIGASRADAEDVAQHAMTKAGECWTAIRSPRPWVRKVAMRAYLNVARDRSA
jgi:DNA-directed RNA polymerase specialized sigma24 family protein